MIEVEIDSIRVSLMNQQRVVLLKDINGERYLPIFIGQWVAEAITIELQEGEQPRPLTHDLLKSMVEALGGTIKYVLINDLRREIFYAKIVVEMEDGKQIEVDSRSSDAIAVAVRANCGIFVNESVMEKAGIAPDEDIAMDDVPTAFLDVPDAEGRDEEETAKPSEPVDEAKLSAFADFLNTLDLDELEDDDDK